MQWPIQLRVHTAILALLLIATGSRQAVGGEPDSVTKRPNRLIDEKSPYLLQHADNPVDWYPWGDEAFEKARQEDKPIFLSIGYATCHWCHVMEHESFEDVAVAAVLNETFVCIKVDREERPDIDRVYMTVCQMLTGSGGWPLTIVMTPDKKPFFAGTYFPKDSRFGRIGLLELAPRIGAMWKTSRQEFTGRADRITAALRRAPTQTAGADPDLPLLDTAYRQLGQRFDEQHGGFGRGTKFPIPHNLFFLLRYWKRTSEKQALAMTEATLQAMRRGGIYDQVGFGFHRYATDPEWRVPHFEKMLYDQALLAMAYTEAYQATGNKDYETTAREILEYVRRDMTDPAGGFYSAEDADSEGTEGAFYLWTTDELRAALGDAEADLVGKVFNVKPEGNYAEESGGRKSGRNILFLDRSPAESGARLELPEAEWRQRLEAARRKLYEWRKKRIPPLKDDKILADWNGLMIAALAKAAQAFDAPEYALAAARAAAFVQDHMRDKEGRLLHRWRQGHAAISAHADDYAFLVWGLTELYEATYDARHLSAAIDLNAEFLKECWDERAGGFFFTAARSEEVLVRDKQVDDGALPSANSVALLNLARLGRMTGDTQLEAADGRLARAFGDQVRRAPAEYTHFLTAMDFVLGPSYEVVVVGRPQAPDTRAALRAIGVRYGPDTVVLLRPAEDPAPHIARLAPFTDPMTLMDGQATLYVCADRKCERPTTDVQSALKLLDTPPSNPEQPSREHPIPK